MPGKSGKSFEDALKSFDSVPLFMKELPSENEAADENNGGPSGDTTMEALKSLAFSGTPNEQAANFKGHGNDYFKGKRYKEAVSFYDKAIDADPDDQALLLSLYLNRAACNLELSNWRSALRDTSKALGLDPRSSKAFYRAAKALQSLGKFIEAIDCCDHVLEIEPNNVEVQRLKSKIVEQGVLNEKREAESKERQRRAKEMDVTLKKAFLARGLWIKTSPRPPSNPSEPHFDEQSLPEDSKPSYPLNKNDWTPPDIVRAPMIFPVMFLYPQHAQSDFISDFHEDTTIGDHVDAMFPESGPPLPWDAQRQYRASNLNAYASTHRMRLLKLGRRLSLREVCDQGAKEEKDSQGKVARDGVVLQDGILSLILLPKGSKAEKDWVEQFKSKRELKRSKGELD